MYFAGIDVGSLTAEGVIARELDIVGTAQIMALPNPVDSARQVLQKLFSQVQVARSDISFIVSTGYGREKIVESGLAHAHLSEISCHGYGAFCSSSKVRTIVDIGGQDAKAIRIDENGDLKHFVMNDKCAAGTGHFLELMSRTLQVALDELGPLALSARGTVDMSSRCSVFVETEVLYFLQRGVDKADIASGITRAMAERVAALARRVSPAREAALTGGVAKNIAVKRELEKRLRLRFIDLTIDPQLVGAFGAAMLAQRQGAR